jgi:hypothetical protein
MPHVCSLPPAHYCAIRPTDLPVGDNEYVAAFRTVLLPVANEFQPDLIIMAGSFDSACAVTPLGMHACFYTIHRSNSCAIPRLRPSYSDANGGFQRQYRLRP